MTGRMEGVPIRTIVPAVILVTLVAVMAFACGWGAGVITSNRVNTAAARAYAESLDMQARAEADHRVSVAVREAQRLADLQCTDALMTVRMDLTKTRASYDVALANAAAKSLSDVEGWRAAASDYSTTITGLRAALTAHGIQEPILPVRTFPPR